MDNLVSEFEKIILKQREIDEKSIQTLDGILAKFQGFVGATSPAKFVAACKSFKDNCSEMSESMKNHYSAIGKFIKSVDKKFKLELPLENDDEANSSLNENILNLVIVNHFFREARFEEGETFAREAGVSVPDELKHQFFEMFNILEAIKNRDLLPGIAWCKCHREKLLRKGSTLEFSMHRLQYAQLLCSKSRHEALRYAQTHFLPFSETNIKDIQKLMAAVIYGPHLKNSPYSDLLSPKHWEHIQLVFTREFCSLLGFPCDSPLYTCLVVGTNALPKLLKISSIMKEKKAEWSQQDEMPIETDLANDQKFHSIFACPVLKTVSTEDNPPMMMPCGHVICKEALVRLSKGSSSRFKCPYCPSESIPSQAQRVYF